MVPAGIFNSLSALGSLDLSLNQLTELPAGIFNSLTNLTVLGLGENQLMTLDANIFSDLESLTSLDLSSNQLTELPAGIFSGLEMLTGVTVAGNATNPLPLTVTIQETGSGMAVIEVAAGVPFTSVTATLSITGGTFSGENATTSVTLSTGQTRSSPFAFTVDEPTMTTPVPEAMIRITDTASDPTNILTGFTDPTGYSGFTLVASGDRFDASNGDLRSDDGSSNRHSYKDRRRDYVHDGHRRSAGRDYGYAPLERSKSRDLEARRLRRSERIANLEFARVTMLTEICLQEYSLG